MATTLTHNPSATVRTITKVLGYTSFSDAPTGVHWIIGLASPDFTLQAVRSRTGTFEFLCMDETEGIALRAFLSQDGSYTLVDDETEMADTTFLVTGTITFTLDDDTRLRCVVSADYTEVVRQ